MNSYNCVALQVNHNLRRIPNERRQKLVKKVISNISSLGVFDTLVGIQDDNLPDAFDREEMVKAKQIEYGFTPDEIEEGPQGQDDGLRFGRSVAHDAVAQRKFDIVKQIASETPEMFQERDNGGSTALAIAFLANDREMIELFKTLKLI